MFFLTSIWDKLRDSAASKANAIPNILFQHITETIKHNSFACASRPINKEEEKIEKEIHFTPKPMQIFIAHGKNKIPLEQLKKILNQFKVPYSVAIDEPNVGRPIPPGYSPFLRDES